MYPTFRWQLTAQRPIPGYPETLEHIGHHILKHRLELGLQQKQAARQIGIHPGSLENWEHGRTTPADRFVPAVVRFLGYSPLPAPSTRGERVAYERVLRGWSRKRLAALARVDEATVRRIEEDSARVARRPVLSVRRALQIGLYGKSVGERSG